MMTLPAYKLQKYKGPRWRSIEFEADEIKQAWPKPPPPKAEDWMLNEAKQLHSAGRIGKREDMIGRCIAATNCTRRQALAAHGRLPAELRRPRGKPTKNSG
jgi:hypothetical protein